MQTLTDSQLLAEIDAVRPLVEACEQSPETRRILLELELGRRNLLGDTVDSASRQVVERAVILARVKEYADLANRLIVIGDELEHREYRRRVNPEALLKRLAETTTDFWSVFHELRHWSEPELFEFLFPVACDGVAYPWPACNLAAELLITLDPRCPMTCQEALVRVSRTNLDASLRKLPFYLVTQFGKFNVLKEAKEFLSATGLSEEARQNVDIVRYWSSMPPSSLCHWRPTKESQI